MTILFSDSLFGSGTLPGSWDVVDVGGTGAVLLSNARADLNSNGFGLDCQFAQSTAGCRLIKAGVTTSTTFWSFKCLTKFLATLNVPATAVAQILTMRNTALGADIWNVKVDATSGALYTVNLRRRDGSGFVTALLNSQVPAYTDTTMQHTWLIEYDGSLTKLTVNVDGVVVATLTDPSTAGTVTYPDRVFPGITANSGAGCSGEIAYDAISIADATQVATGGVPALVGSQLLESPLIGSRLIRSAVL